MSGSGEFRLYPEGRRNTESSLLPESMFDKGEAREWRGQVIFRFLAQLEGGALFPFGNEREWARKILGFAEYEAPLREQEGWGLGIKIGGQIMEPGARRDGNWSCEW